MNGRTWSSTFTLRAPSRGGSTTFSGSSLFNSTWRMELFGVILNPSKSTTRLYSSYVLMRRSSSSIEIVLRTLTDVVNECRFSVVENRNSKSMRASSQSRSALSQWGSLKRRQLCLKTVLRWMNKLNYKFRKRGRKWVQLNHKMFYHDEEILVLTLTTKLW